MTEPMKVVPIRLRDARRPPAEGDEPVAALYVMVTADGCDAKVGALERAARAEPRRREVAKKHPTQIPTPPPGVPIRLAVVAELDGLALRPASDREFSERWAEVEHLEWALRLVLARRLGRLAAWTEWIHLTKPVPDDQWVGHVERAWGEVCSLGRG